MKLSRVITVLATFSLVELIGRYPVRAGILTLLGIGGGTVGVANLMTPAITPQVSAYFNQNQSFGTTNNILKPNNGSAGASFLAPGLAGTGATGSFGMYFEASVDSNLGFANGGTETLLSALALSLNELPGLPTWLFQFDPGSIQGAQWWKSTNAVNTGYMTVSGTVTNYATGFYPFTASGGGCLREPSGIWQGGAAPVEITDPGFECSTAPTISLAAIPGDGAQVPTGLAASQSATTCVSNSPVFGEMKVTVNLAVAHGLSPGMQYTLQGFNGTGFTGYNATYIALPGTTGSTLVGETTTGGGTCPTSPLDTSAREGTAMGGTGATFTFPAISTTFPLSTPGTGITSKNGQHICGFIGEDGDDSSYPGGQFLHMVDDKGNPLPGAPALVPWLNQGTANFTGYVTLGTQSSSLQALTVTAMNPYVISAGSYNSATGFMTFTTTTAPGFIPGSEFTVSGMTNSGSSVNQTYVAVNPQGWSATTYGTSTTIYGSPISGPVGTPQPFATPPTSIATGGSPQMVSVIVPGMSLLGGAPDSNGFTYVAPFGTFSGTGTGGVGTYALIQNQGRVLTFTVSAVNTSTGVITTSAANPALVVGTQFTLNGNTYTVTNVSATANTFTVTPAGTLATGTGENTGAIGSSGSPVTIYLFAGTYGFGSAAATGTAPSTGVYTPRVPSFLSDFAGLYGGANSGISGSTKTGWGGSLGNVAMLYGPFPQQTGGAPSTADLAALCKKTTDIRTFAAANGLTTRSLYRMNDPGVWGDSSNATITGYISGASGSTATLNVVSTTYGSLALATGTETAKLTAPAGGLAGVSSSATPTIPLTTSVGSTYTVTFPSAVAANLGSLASPVTFNVGAYLPAAPLNAGNFLGGISGNTLTVSSLNNGSNAGSIEFTGTLGTNFTGSVSGNTLNVTAISGGGPVIGINTVISDSVQCVSGCMTAATVTAFGTGAGFTGTYTLSGSAQTIASRFLFGSGPLPGAPNNLQTVNPSGTGSFIVGQAVTGATLTGGPLLITAIGGNGLTVAPSYYPNINADSTMVASLTTLVPGSYVQAAGTSQTAPVKVLNYTGACGQSSAYNGGPGCYNVLGAPSGGVASGTVFTANSIQDGGAIAPGPALTIRDQGPGITFPVTNYGAGTGTLWLSGTYDTAALGGSPSAIQAQVSLSANGPPVSGCAACAWTNLSSYASSLSSGTVHNWSGQALNIPANYGPLYVSVRASNGAAYATMPSAVRVGLVFDIWGEGQAGAFGTSQSGANIGYYSGLWNYSTAQGFFGVVGPPIGSTPLVPGQITTVAGDRFGVTGTGSPILSEGVGAFEQTLGNAFGWPVGLGNITRDGIGIEPMTLGNSPQAQTVGVGNGTLTTWCSASTFCANASPSAVSVSGPLFPTYASLTGATLAGATIDNGSGTGTPGGTVLTVPATTGLRQGMLEPGMVLSGNSSLSGSPTLVNCLTGCTIGAVGTGGSFSAQTWAVSSSQGVSGALRAEPPGGTAPWPTFAIQQVRGLPVPLGGFGSYFIKAGTFQISVNGTAVCQDSQTFAYNNMGGNCTGAAIASSFVNYQTGDYEIVFSTPPANNAVIIASWTNIVTTAGTFSTLSRPQNIDLFGDGTAQNGGLSAMGNRTPGGVSGHIDAGCSSELSNILAQFGASAALHYELGAPGYSEMASWLYDTRYPSTIPGFSASTPFLSTGQWRVEGPNVFISTTTGVLQQPLCDQWGIDVVSKSTFSGSTSSGTDILTLAGPATGRMWEGEIIACAPLSLTCNIPAGTYIVSLASGTWGGAGSTYNLNQAGCASGATCTGLAMQNAVYYQGPGPALYAGPLNDIAVQTLTFATSIGQSVHMGPGPAGGRRVGARLAASSWCGLNGSVQCSAPTLDRVKADAGGCDTSALAGPCLDTGNTYAASATATWTGATITVTGGLAAHARPFVDGQAVTCSACNSGLFITSVSLPPTQDATHTNASQLGNTFTITTNAAIGGSGSGTITAGCKGTAGIGSNCIDIAVSVNNTGTFGTAAAIATCGANNFNGNAPNYNVPSGKCQDNGIGEIVRTFRIGTTQAMTTGSPGSVFDDGIDFLGVGAFNRNAAYTCNIVAAKVVQCVKGLAYAEGVPIGPGLWTAPAQAWASTSVQSATYSTSTGILSLTFPGTPLGAGVGSSLNGGLITVSGLAGSGNVASLNGTWAITSTLSAGSAINLGAPAALGSITITGSTGSIAAGSGTFVQYGDLIAVSGRLQSLLGYVGGQSFPIASSGSGYTPGMQTVTGTGCGVTAGGYSPKMDITIGSGGSIIDAVPSATSSVSAPAMGLGVGTGCTFTPTGSGTGGSVGPLRIAPFEGAGGVGTANTDSNTLGMFLYDNSGFSGNPLNGFFACSTSSGYCEPGMGLEPFGIFEGAQVSG